MNTSNVLMKGSIVYYNNAGNKVKTSPVELGPFASMAESTPQVATPYARAMLVIATDGGKGLIYSVTTDNALHPIAVKTGYPVQIVK